jgi:hypothetical protein
MKTSDKCVCEVFMFLLQHVAHLVMALCRGEELVVSILGGWPCAVVRSWLFPFLGDGPV